jgi:hypothetical protein
MKSRSISGTAWWGALAAVCLLCAPIPVAFAQTQTAQSIMIDLTYDSTAYVIEGTITWTYHRGTHDNPDCAMNAYTNAWDGNPPAVTTGSGADPGPVSAPAPDGVNLQNDAQAERCTFFCGGGLTSTSYTRTVNQVRGWKRTFTYNITPISTSVPAKTCWTSEETGGSVDAGFGGFACSDDPQFDNSEAFQLVFQGDRDYTLDIPPAPSVNWAAVPGGGFTPSAPAATVLNGNLALFVRGSDDQLYVNWLLTTNQWTGWARVPGGGFTPSTPAATVLNGNLALFVRGSDDGLYVNWLLPNFQWTGWGHVPGGGSTPSAPAATVFQDDLALFVRGGDDGLYVNWLLPNFQWTGWGHVPGGGSTPSTPAATVLDDDLALFVRGEDNQLYVNFTVTGP